jgi:hypothetical protein
MGEISGDVDGLKRTLGDQGDELPYDLVGSTAAFEEHFCMRLWVLTRAIVESELHVQRITIPVESEARTDPDLQTLADLFDHLVRKSIKGRKDLRTSLGKTGVLCLLRGDLETSAIAPLRRGALLEVGMRNLSLGDSLNVGKKIPPLGGENLMRKRHRHDESIDQKAQRGVKLKRKRREE